MVIRTCLFSAVGFEGPDIGGGRCGGSVVIVVGTGAVEVSSVEDF